MDFAIKYFGGTKEGYPYDMLWVKNMGNAHHLFPTWDSMIYCDKACFIEIDGTKLSLAESIPFLINFYWVVFEQVDNSLIFTVRKVPYVKVTISPDSKILELESIEGDVTSLSDEAILAKIGIFPIK
jgi:hypothetical protein